mgnify:FL=1
MAPVPLTHATIYIEGRLPKGPGPGGLRLATWNINSVRLRLALVKRLIGAADPDIVCLQETTSPDEKFPVEALAKLGFIHQVFHGMKGYNGVAILSRRPLDDPGDLTWCGRNDCRHTYVRGPGGIEIHNVYVPAGGDVADPKSNPKFAHKLDFVRAQAAWWAHQKRRPSAPRILVGDLNVAPLESDVWSHRQLLNVVSHTPVEVELLTRMQRAGGWVDALRHFAPEPARLYTWWSYRNRDWRASDRGRRLDHVWVSPDLKRRLIGAYVLKGARDWPAPSDHVPVVIDVEI